MSIGATAVTRSSTPNGEHYFRSLYRRRRLTAVPILLGLAALNGVLRPLALAAWSGSLWIPHNDAWAFSRAACIFGLTGHITLFNWNEMSLVGEYVPLGPLARSIALQQVYVAVLALVGLAASFDLLRAYCGERRAALGVLVLTAWPGFGLLSTSMMTDMPAFALLAVTLALGRRALERGSGRLLVLCTLTGFWAFTVREQAGVALAAVYGGALLRPGLRTRRFAAVLGTSGLAVLVAGYMFEHWRRSVPGGSPPSLSPTRDMSIQAIATIATGGWLMLGLFAAPLLVSVRPRQWSRSARVVSVLMFGWLVYQVIYRKATMPQNYLSLNGSYSSAYLGRRGHVLPLPVWDALYPLAIVSAALLAGLVVGRVRRMPREMLIVGSALAAGTIVEIGDGQILFDRYLLPLFLPVATLALLKPGTAAVAAVSVAVPAQAAARTSATVSASAALARRTRVAIAGAAALGAFLAAVTGLLTANALATDAATWHAAQQVVDAGLASPDHVDAGFAWTGYHSPRGFVAVDRRAESGIYIKSDQLGNDHPCYVVASSPQRDKGWRLAFTVAHREYGFFGPTRRVYVYRTAERKCR